MNASDIVIQGVFLGSLFGLYAIGLSLVFGVMRVVNLAHGDFIILNAYLLLTFTYFLDMPLYAAFLVCLFISFCCGYLLQSHILERLGNKQVLPPLIVTFCLSIVLQNGLLEIFSADVRTLTLGGLENQSVALFGKSIGIFPLITLVTAISVVLALSVIFNKTEFGRSLRATSDDPNTAIMMGINTKKIASIAMGIAMIVSLIAALFLGIKSNFDPTLGPARLIYAFEAVIIGGLGSIWGTFAGGIILGIAHMVGAYIGPEYQVLAGHVTFLVILILRPKGLFFLGSSK
ncbi:branched-chain amino acid ABC transporter permease [Alteromonas sp. P256]|uniref:branched-chain amino acid ABC transporter permease n=1 Tax=Alteromonas sp. P256 TaxID=3117399 RepID=UPI002FE3F28A